MGPYLALQWRSTVPGPSHPYENQRSLQSFEETRAAFVTEEEHQDRPVACSVWETFLTTHDERLVRLNIYFTRIAGRNQGLGGLVDRG